MELEPDNQKFVNDLEWTLLQAGHILEARKTLERAVSMDPSGRLAQENLRICRPASSTDQARLRWELPDPPCPAHIPVKRTGSLPYKEHGWPVILAFGEGQI